MDSNAIRMQLQTKTSNLNYWFFEPLKVEVHPPVEYKNIQYDILLSSTETAQAVMKAINGTGNGSLRARLAVMGCEVVSVFDADLGCIFPRDNQGPETVYMRFTNGCSLESVTDACTMSAVPVQQVDTMQSNQWHVQAAKNLTGMLASDVIMDETIEKLNRQVEDQTRRANMDEKIGRQIGDSLARDLVYERESLFVAEDAACSALFELNELSSRYENLLSGPAKII
jgi:hypothetical protein